MMPKPKYTDFKFEDFQKSEMIIEQSIDRGILFTTVCTIQNGILIFLKGEHEHIKQ